MVRTGLGRPCAVEGDLPGNASNSSVPRSHAMCQELFLDSAAEKKCAWLAVWRCLLGPEPVFVKKDPVPTSPEDATG